MFIPNIQKIIRAITSSKISPSAKEQAGILVESWIDAHGETDSQYKTLAVEVPWYYWIQPGKTVLVGVMDRIAQDKFGLFGSEWKSCKEPRQNQDGSDSAWWNEEVWLDGISKGTQVSIYGLALHRGTFVTGGGRKIFNASDPRIMVRAAVKSNPPRFWPTDPNDGVFEFPNSYLDGVVGPAIISKAEQIRAARKLGTVPWALPGNHCYNRFRKECPYHEPFCLAHEHPDTPPTEHFDMSDPGSAAIAHALKEHRLTPDTVIFSASSYDTAQQCPERYRILVGGYAPKEEDENLGIGTGLHAGVAEFYRQQQASQLVKISQKPLDRSKGKK